MSAHRHAIITGVNEAMRAGARQSAACDIIVSAKESASIIPRAGVPHWLLLTLIGGSHGQRIEV